MMAFCLRKRHTFASKCTKGSNHVAKGYYPPKKGYRERGFIEKLNRRAVIRGVIGGKVMKSEWGKNGEKNALGQ